MTGNPGVEVGHHALLPHKRPRVEFRVEGHANHRASIVDADAVAGYVAGECAQILHTSFPGPEKSMKSCVARQVRATHDLTSVVNAVGGVSARLSGFAAEI